MRDWKKKSKKTLGLYKENLPAAVYEKAQSHLDEILASRRSISRTCFSLLCSYFSLIALYKAIKNHDPAHAYKQASELFWEKQVIPGTKALQRLLKIPGLYKLIPRLTVFAVKKNYKASREGFRYDFLETSPSCVRLTFYQCPYYNYCAQYGVPELCDVFCTSDDIAAEAMAPYIQFARTQTIGRGGTCCDFDYEISPEFQDKHTRHS